MALTCRHPAGRTCGQIHQASDPCCYDGGSMIEIPERGGDHVMRLPDGRRMAVGLDNGVFEFTEGLYVVDCGGCAAIGELFQGEAWTYRDRDYTCHVNGVVDPIYVDRSVLRRVRAQLAMSDGEYELAIGEGIRGMPGGDLLLETIRARKARALVGRTEVA